MTGSEEGWYQFITGIPVVEWTTTVSVRYEATLNLATISIKVEVLTIDDLSTCDITSIWVCIEPVVVPSSIEAWCMCLSHNTLSIDIKGLTINY